MLSKMATVEIIDENEQMEQPSDLETMPDMETMPEMEMPPDMSTALGIDGDMNIQEELENAADDLDSNYDDEYDYDEVDDLQLDDDYLDNYENELNYGDVLGQFLEDEDGKNIAENLSELVKIMKEIKDVLKFAVTKNSNAIDQNSKCIIKLQKTIESAVIDNIQKKNK